MKIGVFQLPAIIQLLLCSISMLYFENMIAALPISIYYSVYVLLRVCVIYLAIWTKNIMLYNLFIISLSSEITCIESMSMMFKSKRCISNDENISWIAESICKLDKKMSFSRFFSLFFSRFLSLSLSLSVSLSLSLSRKQSFDTSDTSILSVVW